MTIQPRFEKLLLACYWALLETEHLSPGNHVICFLFQACITELHHWIGRIQWDEAGAYPGSINKWHEYVAHILSMILLPSSPSANPSARGHGELYTVTMWTVLCDALDGEETFKLSSRWLYQECTEQHYSPTPQRSCGAVERKQQHHFQGAELWTEYFSLFPPPTFSKRLKDH